MAWWRRCWERNDTRPPRFPDPYIAATMPPPIEPTLAAYSNPFLRYFAATRPAFLSVTFAAALLGLATAFVDGMALKPLAAFFTVFFALVAHAGINVLNDYYDELNG